MRSEAEKRDASIAANLSLARTLIATSMGLLGFEESPAAAWDLARAVDAIDHASAAIVLERVEAG